MNTSVLLRVLPALILVGSAMAEPESRKDVTVKRHVDRDGPPGPKFTKDLEREKVAFLGVETAPVNPTVAAQLGLPRDTGLVVRRVADGSPAANVLKEHDVLTKLDDQILINMQQLGVLVRGRKAGDEVKLTYLRGGKETVIKAKLAEQEVPKLAFRGFPPEMGLTGPGEMFFSQGGFPGFPGHEPADVMRMIGKDRPHWFSKPRVHVVKRGGEKGSTVLDLPSGSFVFSDDQGTIELAANDGKRELTVKNAKGDVTFQGPLNGPEDHAKLPPEVLGRLDAIGGAELGFDDEGLDVETNVVPAPTRTRQALPLPSGERERPMRSL